MLFGCVATMTYNKILIINYEEGDSVFRMLFS